MIALLQWLAIIGLGAAAVVVLRYQPTRTPPDPEPPIRDGAPEVG